MSTFSVRIQKFSKSSTNYFHEYSIVSFTLKKWQLLIFKGIVHQFWIYNSFFVSQQNEHFLWKVHLDKTTLTRINKESNLFKVSPTEFCYIYYMYITRTDFERRCTLSSNDILADKATHRKTWNHFYWYYVQIFLHDLFDCTDVM